MLCPSAYSPSFGGVEELTHRLAVEYQKRGHEVLVVTAQWPLDLPKSETIKGVQVRRIDYVMPARKVKNLATFVLLFPLRLLELALIIRDFRPDVINIQCVSAQGLYLWLLHKILRFRLVVTLQGEQRMDAHQIYQRSRLMRFMLARLLRSANYVTACSKAALVDEVENLWKSDPTKSKIIWNGVDLAEFQAIEVVPENIGKPYIFAIGRQVYNKGFDLLIKAFNQVVEEYPDVNLIIGGDGPEHQNLRQQITELGLASRVKLPGKLDRQETVGYFQNCLFFVLPSRYEPFGIVNLEAMAAGKAVVAFNTGGVSEIVKQDETGLLISSDDVSALANSIAHLLENPELANTMGKKGKQRVEEYFTWPAIAEKYLQLYNQV